MDESNASTGVAKRTSIAAQPARVTKRRGETRQRLLDAAVTVFAERGFGHATVEDVCDRAGFTRGAFYSNFASMDELFFALYEDRAGRLIQAVRTAVGSAAEGAEPVGLDRRAIATAVERVLQAQPVERQRYLLTTEFVVHALRRPELARTLAEHRHRLRQELIPVLRGALGPRGRSAPESDLDGLARTVVAIQEGMWTQELLESEDPTLPELHARALSTVLAGWADG